MRFKVLKHKMIDVFGVFEDPHDFDNDPGYEIFQSGRPELFGSDSTMDDFKSIYLGHPAYKQLDDYDLIEVELKYII